MREERRLDQPPPDTAARGCGCGGIAGTELRDHRGIGLNGDDGSIRVLEFREAG